MQKVTFKQYNTFVSSEDLSEEQLTEIFGKFFGRDDDKMKKLQAQKDELKKAADAKKKEIDKKKDELWAAAKNKAETGKKPSPLMQKSTSNMRAGERRAVDRDPFGHAFEEAGSLAKEALDKICKTYGISMAACKAIFLGGSSADMQRAMDKLDAAGFDDAATTYAENKAFYTKAGLNKSHYNALVKASLNESVMSGVDQELQDLWPDLESGKVDLYDILSHKDKTGLSKEARSYLQHKFDSISSSSRLHPDDDFEGIIEKMMNDLEADYS
jgi:hypothetical protein